jgi:FMN phosphatase YigB (HAD superfamily)
MSRLIEMPAGRYLAGRDTVSAMLSHFLHKSGPNMLDLDKIQAVLFDLDGTLIDVDMQRFVPGYLRRLTENMGAQVNPQRATRALHQAVAAMFANADGKVTLENILLGVLQSQLDLSPASYAASLERFCRNDLESLRPMVKGHPLSPQLIEASLARGWQTVLATNPIFPRAVIGARLAWGALDSEDFDHITAYETAHFCKPNPTFFEEILERLQLPAGVCLMVGNDTEHDLVAGQVGMQTCLLTPWSIRRFGASFKADWQGTHDELLAMITPSSPVHRRSTPCPD